MMWLLRPYKQFVGFEDFCIGGLMIWYGYPCVPIQMIYLPFACRQQLLCTNKNKLGVEVYFTDLDGGDTPQLSSLGD
jgi:hypothetical protein